MTLTLFDTAGSVSAETAPSVLEPALEGDWWDLSGTIHEYSYLTHNFFRYYGKFPSALAKQVIQEFLPLERGGRILDTYCGCGTTLVEACLAGHHSVGTDINPLAILATTVKTRPLAEQELERSGHAILGEAGDSLRGEALPSEAAGLSPEELDKWFPGQAASELLALRQAVYSLDNGPVKDFYLLTFAAIIRRVSTAFDAEVRPHFNKNKPGRQPLEAFARKALDMRKRLREFGSVVRPENQAAGYLADNRALPTHPEFAPESFDLALTHPPYLNCFDYIPVYRFELQWLRDLDRQWSLQENNLLGLPRLDYAAVRQQETRSWPAKPKVMEEYRLGNLKMLEQLFPLLRPGAACCVVIGDSTLNGVLLPVHQWFIEMGREVGFRHARTIYRTTHYGTGKYAYEDRSHYHGAAQKRDAILVFKKPD